MRTTHAGALMPHQLLPTSVVLMLHFDGPNGSTTFVDSSRSAHPMTAGGAAAISTAESLLTSSGNFNNEPTTLVSCPNSEDFNFGAGAWTIEAFLWVRPTNNNAFLCGSYQGAAFSGFYCLVQFATPAMSFYRDDEPFTVYTVSGGALSTETWHHVAWVRDNDEIRIYQDGGMLGRLVINAAAGVRFRPTNSLSAATMTPASPSTALMGMLRTCASAKGSHATRAPRRRPVAASPCPAFRWQTSDLLCAEPSNRSAEKRPESHRGRCRTTLHRPPSTRNYSRAI